MILALKELQEHLTQLIETKGLGISHGFLPPYIFKFPITKTKAPADLRGERFFAVPP